MNLLCLRSALFGCLVFSLLPLVGCGSSQDDVMMKAARRVRPKDAEEQPVNPPPAQDQPVPQQVEIAADIAPQAAQPSALDGAPAAPSTVPVAVRQIPSIADRKPATSLTAPARRNRAVESMEKIAAALNSYSMRHGLYPPAALKSSGGIPMLSWRVAILPELGYTELYNKFNLEEPWNGPNNRKLLDLIPDEFVSPERFDTKTNFLVPTASGYLFDGGRDKRANNIEDGAENTLLLVEVDDSLAVPWTQPADFAGHYNSVKNGLGGLRGDGAFAVWANGWPTLIANEASSEQIHNAFTWESGDGQLAVTLHRPIVIESVVPVAQVAASLPAESPTTAQPAYALPTAGGSPRVATPKPVAVAEAGKRLREVFADRLKTAKKDSEMVALAEELLNEAEAMTLDTPGAFAIQTAAIKLGSNAGKLETVLRGVDQRVSRFDVDAYQENLAALSMFAIDVSQRNPRDINGMLFLRRAIPTTFAAVSNDDYDSANLLIQHSLKFINQPRDEFIPKSLGRLRAQLTGAKQQYDRAKVSLAKYRTEPNDADAASAFGRFLCFIKGDWSKGLPLLTEGGSGQLRDLATLDLKGARSLQDFVALGDNWWQLSDAAPDGIYRQASRDRASYWYSQAFAQMPESLDKLHVKARLDEAGNAEKTSPLALLESIADAADVNLSVSLVSLSEGGARFGRPNDEDE